MNKFKFSMPFINGWKTLENNLGFSIVGSFLLSLFSLFSFRVLRPIISCGYFKSLRDAQDVYGSKPNVGDVLNNTDNFLSSLIFSVIMFALLFVIFCFSFFVMHFLPLIVSCLVFLIMSLISLYIITIKIWGLMLIANYNFGCFQALWLVIKTVFGSKNFLLILFAPIAGLILCLPKFMALTFLCIACAYENVGFSELYIVIAVFFYLISLFSKPFAYCVYMNAFTQLFEEQIPFSKSNEFNQSI